MRNHSAKLNLQAMRLGDHALFYHSNIGKAAVGVVEVVREHYPDPPPTPARPGSAWTCAPWPPCPAR